MHKPAWKKFVRELTDSGFESPYLDRLRHRVSLEQAHDDLEKEILREMASALGRAEDKVNLALLELDLIERDLEILMEDVGQGEGWVRRANARVDDFNRQRDKARQCLWELVIHREALGFRRNEILRQFYPIPPKKKRVQVS